MNGSNRSMMKLKNGRHGFTPPAQEIPPFSLLEKDAIPAVICDQLAREYGLNPKDIEDVYPCTPMQADLLSLTSQNRSEYVLHAVLDLNPLVSEEKFRNAWDEVFRATPILRTRILLHDHLGFLQVVLKEEPKWFDIDDHSQYSQDNMFDQVNSGRALTRFTIVQGKSGSPKTFIWAIHHALFDWWALSLITRMVSDLYLGHSLKQQIPFKESIAYMLQQNDEATKEYWGRTLQGCEPVHFPSTASVKTGPILFERYCHVSAQVGRRDSKFRRSTLSYAAWAMVMSYETGARDIIFGGMNAGRHADNEESFSIIGPTISAAPVRVQIHGEEKVANFLKDIEKETRRRNKHNYIGLSKISEINIDTQKACGFETLLVVQPAKDDLSIDSSIGRWRTGSKDLVNTTYSLTIRVFIGEQQTTVLADYDPQTISAWKVDRLLTQFSSMMAQLAKAKAETTVNELNALPTQELELLWGRNCKVPASVDRCVHELIEEQVQMHPDAPALDSWDGKLTYRELDDLATRLAYKLVRVGVASGSVVPLCFEKSLWTTVAMLAAVKAGGTLCMLDPSHPGDRLRSIIHQTGSRIILSSESLFQLSSRLAPHVISVGPEMLKFGDINGFHRLPNPNPSLLLYIVFTSGSTGVPKGVLVSHAAFSSSIHHQAHKLGFTSSTRLLDLSTHAFDLFIHNTVVTLATGGCICVPSEADRRDNVVESMALMKPTNLLSTPSAARIIEPSSIKSLKTIVLVGEPSFIQDTERWWTHADVINAYGPSECTPHSVINCEAQNPYAATRIGKGAGMITWVTDPDNHHRLTPLGMVGELLLEGPLLGNGYLGNPEKTASAFVDDPIWLLKGTELQPGRRGRLYKTGDLVRYNEDGSLSYVSRKDTQVKIRGQRVELGEVEYHIRKCMPQATLAAQLAAEVITPGGDTTSPQLAVFFSSSEVDESGEVLAVPAEVEDKLATRMPRYMVPMVYFVLPWLPQTSTDKIDRKRLREMGASYSVQYLADVRSRAQGEKQMPSTETERVLQRLWARVLKIDPASVGVRDNFFKLGGDSITAMRLVAEGRSVGVKLSVASIFKLQTIQGIAAATTPSDASPGRALQPLPFELVSSLTFDRIMSCLSRAPVSVDPSNVEDVLPTTAFQRRYLKICVQQPASALNYFSLHFGTTVKVNRLVDACYHLVDTFPILRTIFVPHVTIHEQVVLRKLEDIVHTIQIDGDIDSVAQDFYSKDTSQREFRSGEPFVAFFLLCHKSQGCRLIVRISHAQYDGICLPLMVQALLDYYHDKSVSSYPTLSVFLAHTEKQLASSTRHWRKTLEGSNITSLANPSRCNGLTSQVPVIIQAECELQVPQIRTGFTLATIISSAWALVLSSFTGSRDVVYGQIVTGRNASIAGIEEIIGPCLNIIPVRVQIDLQQSVTEFLTMVQNQVVSLGQFDSMGLDDVINDCTDWPSNVELDTVIQHIGNDRTPQFKIHNKAAEIKWFKRGTAAFPNLKLISAVAGDRLSLQVSANSDFHDSKTVDTALSLLHSAAIYLSANADKDLKHWLDLHTQITQ